MTNLLILLSTTKLDHLFLTDKKLYLCQIVTFFSLLLIDKGLPTQKKLPKFAYSKSLAHLCSAITEKSVL